MLYSILHVLPLAPFQEAETSGRAWNVVGVEARWRTVSVTVWGHSAKRGFSKGFAKEVETGPGATGKT
jgi:hypothetical protein